MSAIEDGFEPDTVNEALLLMRIRELKLAAYKVNSYDLSPYSSFNEPVLTGRIQPSLLLGAELKCGWENDNRYHVTAQAYRPGKDDIHYGHYLSKEMLYSWTPEAAAQALGKLHKRAIHELANLVAKQRTQP